MNRRKRIASWPAMAFLAFTLISIMTPAQSWASGNPGTIVRTDYGKLEGFVNQEVLVWKGVPYAKPPVGDLRWKAPEDPDPWHGVRDATSPAKKCTQLFTTEEWIRTGVVTRTAARTAFTLTSTVARHTQRDYRSMCGFTEAPTTSDPPGNMTARFWPTDRTWLW